MTSIPKRTETQATGDAGRLGAVVRSSLTRNGIAADVADAYAALTMEMHAYLLRYPKTANAIKSVKETYDVYEGTKKAVIAPKYAERAGALGLRSSQLNFESYGASGGAAVLQVFQEHFEAFARSQGIELNECSLAVARLSLDIAAAGVGSVTAVSGFGMVLAAMAVLSTLKDGYALGQVCIVGKGS